MENKTYANVSNQSALTNNSISHKNTISSACAISPPVFLKLEPNRSIQTYSEEHCESAIVITQPTVNKLPSETVKSELFENNSPQVEYTIDNHFKTHTNRIPTPTVVTTVQLNPRETVNGRTITSMTNVSSHLMSTLNPVHLSEGTGAYFVPGSNYKLPPPSNSDLPSPSSSSTSSNPPSSTQHQHNSTRRHGEGGGDPTRKREMRLQKNRDAARECRRKKKEYIKCLEERVSGLENQNKALIEELRELKELYCKREETTNKMNTNKTTTTTSTR